MKFQTYSQKKDILMKTLSGSSSLFTGPTVVTTVETLSLKDLDDIISKDNVIVVENPNFIFDFLSMKVVDSQNSLKTSITNTNPVFMFRVSSVEVNSMKEFFSKVWNKNDLFFFYSGFIIGKKYSIRIFKIAYEKIKDAISRYEALVRLNESMNINNSIENIREYVNSENFENDLKYVNMDVSGLLKYLWSTFDSNKEDSIIAVPYLNEKDRVAKHLEYDNEIKLAE